MDAVTQKSHEADKQVVTEFARMSTANLRKEMKERGLSRTNSRERMVSLLSCSQAFTRGRNVGLSERPLEDIRPQDTEKKCEEPKQPHRPECPACGDSMSCMGGSLDNTVKIWVCTSMACSKYGQPNPTEETSDSLYKKYVEALRREDRLKGKVGMIVRCSFPNTFTPVDLQRITDRIQEAIEHSLHSRCDGYGPERVEIKEIGDDRDDMADSMRFGAPQPFMMNLETKNDGIPGIKCLLLGIAFLIIGALPCDHLRMDICREGSNLMGQIGLIFVMVSGLLHWRAKRS